MFWTFYRPKACSPDWILLHTWSSPKVLPESHTQFTFSSLMLSFHTFPCLLLSYSTCVGVLFIQTIPCRTKEWLVYKLIPYKNLIFENQKCMCHLDNATCFVLRKMKTRWPIVFMTTGYYCIRMFWNRKEKEMRTQIFTRHCIFVPSSLGLLWLCQSI